MRTDFVDLIANEKQTVYSKKDTKTNEHVEENQSSSMKLFLTKNY